jgi:hypothetical protein
LNRQSDPYTVYYPGDDYVDWVGLSIYHYGSYWPWRQNTVPLDVEFSAIIRGNTQPPEPYAGWGASWPYYDFYGIFSLDGKGSMGLIKPTNQVTKGGKPFFLAETAATYHYDWYLPTWTKAKDYNASLPAPNVTWTTTRLEMKQAWWNQIFNFARNNPKFKAVCSFEFIKSEEDTWRDFTMFGAPGPKYQAGFGADNAVVVRAFSQFVSGLGSAIKWSTYEKAVIVPGANTTGGPTTPSGTSPSGTQASSTVSTSPTKTSGGSGSRMNPFTFIAGITTLFASLIVFV